MTSHSGVRPIGGVGVLSAMPRYECYKVRRTGNRAARVRDSANSFRDVVTYWKVGRWSRPS